MEYQIVHLINLFQCVHCWISVGSCRAYIKTFTYKDIYIQRLTSHGYFICIKCVPFCEKCMWHCSIQVLVMSSELLYKLSELSAYWMFGILEQFIFACLYENTSVSMFVWRYLHFIKTKTIKELILNKSFQLFI